MFKRLVIALAIVVSACPVGATNRVQTLHGMNIQSSWLNQYERDVRLGEGQLIYDFLGGSTSGFYSNLSVVPVTGLYVAVGPSGANTVGSLYQYKAEEATAFGGYPSGTGTDALPVDATQVYVQGLSFANGPNVGPLTPPGTSGKSIDYLIECAVTTIDTNSVAINVVSSTGVVTATTANRDRNDIISCQAKAGTTANTGSQTVPTADSGYVGVGYVAVPYNTTTVTTGMVNAQAPFNGFALASATGAPSLPCATCAVTNGSNTFSAAQTINGNVTIGGNSTLNITGTGTITAPSATINGTLTSGGINSSSQINTVYSGSPGNTSGVVAPVFNSAGTTFAGYHTVAQGVTMPTSSAGGAATATVTFTNAAVFNSGSSYFCTATASSTATSTGLATPAQVSLTSRTTNGFTVNLQGAATTAYEVDYICTGV